MKKKALLLLLSLALACALAAPALAATFVDVPGDAYYARPVLWALTQDITKGSSTYTFDPEATCTRAQIITFLWRAAGSPEAVCDGSVTDVVEKDYYCAPVYWGKSLNMFPGDTFRPSEPCTRLAAVEFMWRAAGSPEAAGEGFADADSSAVKWAVAAGVTTGTSATAFSPNEICTRGQIVTFLYRAFAEEAKAGA